MLHEQRTMALLFLLSLLLSQTLISSAAAELELNVKEVSDVVLPCSLSSKDKNLETQRIDWKKDLNMDVYVYDGLSVLSQDKQFVGRVSHFQEELKNGNASIKITKVKLADSGSYTCIISGQNQKSHIQLQVDCILKDRTAEKRAGACPRPYVASRYPEQDRSELQCEVDGVSDKVEIEWRDSSDHSLDAVKTQHRREDGSYNIILNATVTKSGTYRCVITQRDICHQVSSITDVNIREPPTTGSETHNGWKIAFWVLLVLVLVPVFALVAVVCWLCRTRTSTKGRTAVSTR